MWSTRGREGGGTDGGTEGLLAWETRKPSDIAKFEAIRCGPSELKVQLDLQLEFEVEVEIEVELEVELEVQLKVELEAELDVEVDYELEAGLKTELPSPLQTNRLWNEMNQYA